MKKFFTIAVIFVLIAALFAVPGFSKAVDAGAAAMQDSVLKDGKTYASVKTYASNSSANKGYKVSANKSNNDITIDGVKVGYFYFDKNANTIDIYLIADVTVNVEWHCSKYYAACSLNGIGKYSLPQLLQDNGKTQSFDQIWIVSATSNVPVIPPSPIYYATPMFSGDSSQLNQYYSPWYYSINSSAWENGLPLDRFTASSDNNGGTVQASYIWDKEAAESQNGDIAKFEFNYNIQGNQITGGSDFTIGADNGFVMIVNGKIVANSAQLPLVFGGAYGGTVTQADVDELTSGGFDKARLFFDADWGTEWQRVYTVSWADIAAAFKPGNNSIVIYAYNTPDHDVNYENNKNGTIQSNPACLIFAGTVFSVKIN